MGSSGHLSHLFEDWELTFADLKDVISAAADARLESVTEKTDGTELVFTWHEALGQVRGARNSTDMKNGGLGARELAARFADKEGLMIALTSALTALDDAVIKIPLGARARLFGPSGERWYSIEIMHSAWPRTIRYTGDNIVFHERPVFTVDRATGRVEKDNGTAGAELSKWIGALRQGVAGTSWQLHPKASVALERMVDGTVMAHALSRLDAAMAETGLHDGDTLATYVHKRMELVLDDESGLTLPDAVHAALSARLAGVPGAPTATAIRMLAPELYPKVKELIGQEKQLVERALEPVEIAVREFAAGFLRGVRSLFVTDTSAEAERLKVATAAAIDALKRSNNPAAKAMLASQAAKLQNLDDITPIEGVVFMYRGRPYKLTGLFAPMNRVLSLLAFGKIDEARTRLVEGGHGFEGTRPVSQAELRALWPAIESLLRRAGAVRIEPIGTTWKKDPMGDVDLAIEHPGGREGLHAALIQLLPAGSLRKIGAGVVSIALPGRTDGTVQVDAMVGDVDYLTWARYGPSPDADHPEHSSVKGLVRNMLLNVVAERASGRVFPGKQTAVDRERYVMDFDRGLLRVVQTKRGVGSQGTQLASWKTLEREVIATVPDQIVAKLLGAGHRAAQLRTFEDVVAALRRSPTFRAELLEIAEDLIARLRDHAASGRDLGAPIATVEAAVKRAFHEPRP